MMNHLNVDAYAELSDVVGVRHIMQDACSLSGYSWTPFGFTGKGKWLDHDPAAVILPSSTEEVQKIVRVCNKYKITFKAHATGWGAWGMASKPGMLILDMRRMDKIHKIDEKNQYAIIEPYVLAGQLQAEAFKKGLDCNIVAAGAGHSPLASATSFQGMGSKGQSTSTNERNVLGLEWVTPEGEIIQIGCLDDGMFSGEGPGPGLRGVLRGFMGASGGLGVFTRIGFKLYPWAGPAQPEITGEAPNYSWKIPERTKLYIPYWRNYEDMTAASYKLSEANAATIMTHIPYNAICAYLTRNNNEQHEMRLSGNQPITDEHRRNWMCLVQGHSDGEFAYKKKLIEKIISETNGQCLELEQQYQEILYANLVRVCYLPRVGRPLGDFCTSFGAEESFGILRQVTQKGEEYRARSSIYKGSDERESFFGWSYEGGRYLHWEGAWDFDPDNLQHCAETTAILADSGMTAVTTPGFGMPMLPNYVGPFADLFGPATDDLHVHVRRILHALNPEFLADPSFYIYPDPLSQEQMADMGKHVQQIMETQKLPKDFKPSD